MNVLPIYIISPEFTADVFSAPDNPSHQSVAPDPSARCGRRPDQLGAPETNAPTKRQKNPCPTWRVTSFVDVLVESVT